ncbi:MAG: hypothetical protein FWE18_03245 [Alphaproteobacteria bacterium]|nr:hypothetical protein [Alphaproteobacteria bacterium]
MANSVTYNTDAIQVQDPRKENVVIYAHPGDKINIGFDISALRVEVVNGDLVIKTLGGGSITIANYSIMALQEIAPLIVDSLSHQYAFADFLNSSPTAAAAITSTDNPDSFVVNRVVSTPKSVVSGDYLTSGETFLQNNEYSTRKLVGMVDVDEQHPILAQDVSLSPYMMLRLYPDGVAPYDAQVVYRYNGRTLLNQEEPSTLPVITRNTNPRSNPIYGTKETFSTPTLEDGNVFQVVNTIAGGGNIVGNDYSVYQYSPQVLDYSSMGGNILYRAYTGNQIVRGLQLYLTDANASLSNILIQNVPEGVVFQSTDSTEVQPLGNGMFFILPKAQSQSIDLYFAYNEASAIDSYGNPIGLKDIMQQVSVQIEGYNAKYQQLVLGRTELTLDFRQVRSDGDLNNFSMYNTYTYSTLFDPLIVRATHFDDDVYGGVVNHTYDTLDGNDTFHSGTGNDTVYLGEGDDTYIYNWGNDWADGKATMGSAGNPQMVGVDAIRFDHNAYTYANGNYVFNSAIAISFNNGVVHVKNTAVNPSGKVDNSNSTFQNFDELYLEEDTGVSANQNNTIDISSTAGFRGFKIYSGGHVGDGATDGTSEDTLNIHSSALISFDDAVGAFISTVSTRLNARAASDFDATQNIYFGLYDYNGVSNYFRTINGLNGNFTFLASNEKNFNVVFNGNSAGKHTLDFSLITGNGVVFDANSGITTYGNSSDIIKVINGIFIGTDADDQIYASGIGSMEYYGHATSSSASNGGNEYVSYERWGGDGSGKGVSINYLTELSSGYIEVIKPNAADKDKLYYINDVRASQFNDTFILAYSGSYVIDGFDGTEDTLDYSKDSAGSGGIIVNINSMNTGSSPFGASGRTDKGTQFDDFQNINKIIGTSGDDKFYIDGPQSTNMFYEGGGGYDTIFYDGNNIPSDVFITYTFSGTGGTLVKNTSSGQFTDKLTGFSEVTATNNDDAFITSDDSWRNGNVQYYGGKSNWTAGVLITENGSSLVGAGDVLYLDYDVGVVDIRSLELKFHDIDTLRLSNQYGGTVESSDTYSFNNIWGGTGATAKNFFNASGASSQITFDISNNVANIGGLSLYNFTTLRGSDVGTIFNVLFDPSSGVIQNYTFLGGDAIDTLSYEGNTAGHTPATIDLVFDFGNNSVDDPNNPTSSVQKYNHGTIPSRALIGTDYFSGIENFVGGDGDDVFKLNPNNTTYNIDGGEGFNTVSFVNYFTSVSSANINVNAYTRIRRFELTNFNDVWTITNSLANSDISGGGGIDTVQVDPNVTSVVYNVGIIDASSNKPYVELILGSGNVHKLTFFEVFTGTQSGSDTVNMESIDNADLSTNSNLYFVLNDATVNYNQNGTFDNQGLILNLFGVNTTVFTNVEATMSIVKKNNATDYFNGVSQVNLGGGDNIIHIDLTVPVGSYNGLSINAGSGGNNTIDVSDDGGRDLIFDNTAGGGSFTLGTSLATHTFNITNWNTLITGEGSDTFILGAATNNLNIDAGNGRNILDLSAFTTNLDVVFTEFQRNITVAQGASTIVNYIGNEEDTIKTGSGDEKFMAISANSYTIDGGGGNNSIDYSQAVDSSGFVFNLYIDTANNHPNFWVVKGTTGNTDQLLNIQSISGSTKDDVFNIDFNSGITSIDGGSGANKLEIKSTTTSGYTFDLDNNILYENSNPSQTIGFAHFDILTGSVSDDTFILTDDRILSLRGSVDGGSGGNDTLDINLKDANQDVVDLYADLSAGYIYRKNADNSPNLNDFLAVKNINNIKLGDGDDLIVFSKSMAGGNFSIDAGAGNNYLSFERVNNALTGTLNDMLASFGNINVASTGGTLGYRLTNFADYLEVDSNNNDLLVDGGYGNDTIDYTRVSDNIKIDYSVPSSVPGQIIVSRGTHTDTLLNFNKFVLGAGNNTVIAGDSSIDVNFGSGSGTNTISYEEFVSNSGVIANLAAGTVWKTLTNGQGVLDRITNFTKFIDSQGDDLILASNNVKEIQSNWGNDVLNLTRLTSTSTVVYASNASLSNISNGSGISFNLTYDTALNPNATAHMMGRIIFGDFNSTVKTATVEGRTYNGAAGYTNTLDYSTVSSGTGIYVNIQYGTVEENNNPGNPPTGGNKDTFTNFNAIVGTNYDDNIQGLNASSTISLDLQGGDDTISFTGSSSALTGIEIDGSGNLSMSTITVNKTSGSLITGATNFDDSFFVTDMNLFNPSVSGGVNGNGGNDTLDFSKITSGVTFTIGDVYSFKLQNFNTYNFTSGNDNITWSYDPSTNGRIYVPSRLNFGTGNDTFHLNVDNIAGGTMAYNQDGSANAFLSIIYNGVSVLVDIINLDTLMVDSSSSISLDSYRGIFSGGTYATGADVFAGNVIINSNISFTNGINLDIRNYNDNGSATGSAFNFDSSSIIADINSVTFSNMGGIANIATARPSVAINVSTAQNRDVAIRFNNAVDFTATGALTASSLTLVGNTLTAQFTNSGATGLNQAFSTTGISTSSLAIDSGTFAVQSSSNLSIFNNIYVSQGASALTIDFSGYGGQHGIIGGDDWRLASNAGKTVLNGSLSNAFSIVFDTAAASANTSIVLSATNDTLALDQDITLFQSGITFNGSGGQNTISITNANSGGAIANVESGGIYMISSGNDNVAGAPFASSIANANMSGFDYSNFQIVDMSDSAVASGLNNSNIINIILDPSSTLREIIAPHARAASTTENTMPRSIINGAGWSSGGGMAGVQGGFSNGGTFVASFINEINDPNTMNRMMQVQAQYQESSTSYLFNVNNIQSIFGKRGDSDNVIFGALNTSQFNSLVSQFNNGQYSYSTGSNAQNAINRESYLYLDLEFARDETGSTGNNSQTDNASSPQDIIDFSSWQIFDPNNSFVDFMIAGARGDGSNNGLHMWAVGSFDESNDGATNPIMMVRAAGNQHFILPQTRFYWGASSAYYAGKVYTLEMPNSSDRNIYGIYDALRGNITQGSQYNWNMLVDSIGTTNVSSNITTIGFTTFYLDNNGNNTGNSNGNQTATIGSNNLFLSNKVYIYFSQGDMSGNNVLSTIGSPIDSTNRTNNADRISGNGSNDKADYSTITSGSYYFSWGSWEMQEAQARADATNYTNGNGWVSESVNTAQEYTNAYQDYITDKGTGVGIIFTGILDANRVGITDGYSSQIFYRMQSVNNLVLTGGSDTFATGKLFWGTSGPHGAFADYAYSTTQGKTFLNSVDAGAGMNTFVDNNFSSDTQKNSGGAQSGNVRREIGVTGNNPGGSPNPVDPSNMPNYGLYQYLGYSPAGGGGDQGSFGGAQYAQEGHMERVYIFDDSGANSVLNIRAIATIDGTTYGAGVQASGTSGVGANTADLSNTMPTGTNNISYIDNIVRTTYTNFNKIHIDDYSANLDMRSGYYTGTRDITSVLAKNDSSYKEFDLGGRYVVNENTGVIAKEMALHTAIGHQIRVQWTNVNDPKVDSSIVVADGWNGTNYTSYYGYRNFDQLEIGSKDLGSLNTTTPFVISFVFNSDFDFAKMDGKDFTLDPNVYSGSNVTYNILFQQSIYNYTVTSSGTSKRTYTITEDGSTRKFTFNIWVDNGANINFQQDASDVSVARHNLSPEQLHNLETYGNIDGIDTSGSGNASDSTDSSSNSLSSYGSNTMMSHQQETAAKEANFSDGNSGISSFGRGGRSHDASQVSADAEESKDSSNTHKSDADTRYEQDYGSIYAQKQQEDTSKEEEDSKDSTEEDSKTDSNAEKHAQQDDANNAKAEDGLHNHDNNALDNNQSNNEDNLHNVNDSNKEDGLHNHNDSLHNISDLTLNVSLDGFTNDDSSSLNLDNLFNLADDLLSNNAGLSDSLHEMTDSIQAITEESVNTTNQQDELDSMSFALDSMFNVNHDADANSSQHSADHNNKHKNSSGGVGGNS